MPRCYACGKFVKKPHREIDGRVERAYCDLCYAERDWKFHDDQQGTNPIPIAVPPPPPLTIWEKVKRLFSH